MGSPGCLTCRLVALLVLSVWCHGGEGVGVSMSAVMLLKSVTGLCLRSAHRMGHRLPFDFCR